MVFFVINMYAYVSHKTEFIGRFGILRSPRSSDAYVQFAHALFLLGDAEDATWQLQLAEEKKHQEAFPPSNQVLGAETIYSTLDNWNKETPFTQQLQYWKKVVTAYPEYRDGYVQLSLLALQQQNQEEAKLYMQKAITIDPNNQQLHILAEQVGLSF